MAFRATPKESDHASDDREHKRPRVPRFYKSATCSAREPIFPPCDESRTIGRGWIRLSLDLNRFETGKAGFREERGSPGFEHLSLIHCLLKRSLSESLFRRHKIRPVQRGLVSESLAIPSEHQDGPYLVWPKSLFTKLDQGPVEAIRLISSLPFAVNTTTRKYRAKEVTLNVKKSLDIFLIVFHGLDCGSSIFVKCFF